MFVPVSKVEWVLATRRYAVSIDALRQQNRLETEQVATGTILEIPVTGT